MQQLPKVIQLKKAKPQRGRSVGLNCPAWIEQEFRARQLDKHQAEIRRLERRKATMQTAKTFAAGCAFMLAALASVIVV